MRRFLLWIGLLCGSLLHAQEVDTLVITPTDSSGTSFIAIRDTVPQVEELPAHCYVSGLADEKAVYVRLHGNSVPKELVVAMEIGRDTLYELVTLSDTGWSLVKNFPMMAGDTLCMSLLDPTFEAEWSFRSKGLEPVVQNEDFREFTGDIWYYKDVALLRIEKTRDYPEKMNIVVGLQPGFDLDRLFLKVKLIHPTEGVKEVEKEVRLADADELGKTDRLLRVYIPEWTLTEKGRYFLRISHQHYADRLNGIDFVSYEMLTP